MKRFKNALFLATVASSAIISSGAYAQTPASNDGENVLHGAGATSIQNVLVQELNCKDGSFSLGALGSTTATGTLTVVAEPTDLQTPNATTTAFGGTTTGSPTFNCSVSALDSGFAAKYLATGSGSGRSAWAAYGSVTTLAAFAHTGTQANPNAFGDWTGVQFAFADNVPSLGTSPAGDFQNYSGGTALTGASYVAGGAPVVFPKYVLPVAIAYAPVYGHNNSTNTDYSFNINSTFDASFPATTRILGTNVGGLRLSQATLCGIFEGTIKNWNNASFTTDNGGVSLKASADDLTRWTTDGVPVRIVGRLDRSGTTDIFTRALAQQCSGGIYTQNAETLPYLKSVGGSPDFGAVRPDTGLRFAGTDPAAGSTTRVSNQYFNGSGYTTVTASNGSAAGTPAYPAAASSSAASGTTDGTGFFLVAGGSGNLAAAINFAPDWRSASWFSDKTSTVKNVDLNGKIGYIGSDFIVGSPTSAGLRAAAVENTNGSGNGAGHWVLPSAANGTLAFQAIRPPESDANGNYLAGGLSRTVNIPGYLNPPTGTDTTGIERRTNPRAWYDVIYPIGGGVGLASPTSGYPITGTTQFLGYSCYKVSGGGSNYDAVTDFLKWNLNLQKIDWTGVNRDGIFTRVGSGFADSGLLIRSNIGALPGPWVTAVNETFLDTTDPKSLGLTIRAGSTSTCSTHTGA